MSRKFFWGTVGVLWAQVDYEVRVMQRVQGDHLYLTYEIQALNGATFPLGAANFILSWPGHQMAQLDWSRWEWKSKGMWDAQANAHSYYPMDIRRRDSVLSLNILSRYGGSGVSVPDTSTLIATVRVPILDNSGTSTPQFTMQGGEVLRWWKTPYKQRGRFLPIVPVSLCPAITGFRVEVLQNAVKLKIPEDYLPGRLSIQWYHNGMPVGTGPSFPLTDGGMYYAQINHLCGSVGYSDTVWHRSLGIAEREKYFSVYPNPASTFHFLAQNLTGGKITLYTPMGSVVKEILISNPAWSYTWQPQNVSAGVYILKLETAEKIHYLRLVYVP
ncbi:MAG: T9SS type A sorting domain-containing protein [Bacteroidia bacterium]